MKSLFTFYVDTKALVEARDKSKRTGVSVAFLLGLGLRYVLARVPDEKLIAMKKAKKK